MLKNMSFKVSQYQHIGYDQLVTYCAFILERAGKDVTFEELVKEAFNNFPERFRLMIKDRNWPDAAIINKSWLRARTDKRWIVGSRASGFKVTPAGKKIAEMVAKELNLNIGSKDSSITKNIGNQTRSTRIIKQVLDSEAFKKYLNGSSKKITEYEFCDSIFSTLDSPPNVKRKNMELVAQYAQEVKQPKVLKYLELTKSQFSNLLGRQAEDAGYHGGMMRKKYD